MCSYKIPFRHRHRVQKVQDSLSSEGHWQVYRTYRKTGGTLGLVGLDRATRDWDVWYKGEEEVAFYLQAPDAFLWRRTKYRINILYIIIYFGRPSSEVERWTLCANLDQKAVECNENNYIDKHEPEQISRATGQ